MEWMQAKTTPEIMLLQSQEPEAKKRLDIAAEQAAVMGRSMSPAKTDNQVFVEGPPGQIGGKGGFAGAWDAKIDVEYMGVSWTEERAQENRQVDKPGQKKNCHKDLLVR